MDPKSTSTPNRPGPRKRKGIHEKVISPLSDETHPQLIPNLLRNQKDELNFYNRSISTDESDDSESNEHEEEEAQDDTENENSFGDANVNIHHPYHEKSSVKTIHMGYVITAVIFTLILIVFNFSFSINGDDSNNIPLGPRISDLESQFPLQSKEFWLHLQSGISDVNMLNKPSVYIFLYEKNNENALEKLLKNISVYATCTVNNNCEIVPITLKGKYLNTPELISDYGQIIDKYGPQLQKRHIMIIRNLDEMHSNVAQALHSFCDEYTPLVSKSLFLFTMSVNKFEDEPLHQVLKVLRSKWKDLESDKLEPLLTRISNTVLKVSAETNV